MLGEEGFFIFFIKIAVQTREKYQGKVLDSYSQFPAPHMAPSAPEGMISEHKARRRAWALLSNPQSQNIDWLDNKVL